MPPSSAKAKKGKEFENKLIGKLKTETEKRSIQFIRFYDSFSGYTSGKRVNIRIPGQYADFLFIFNESKCCLIEFKYTEKDCFHLGMLSDSQLVGFENSLKYNTSYFVLVYSEFDFKYYLLNSKKLAEINPKRVMAREFKFVQHFNEDAFTDIKQLFEILKIKYNLGN